MLKNIFGFVGDVVGTAAAIATAPIAIALGCSQELVKRAIKAGCTTQEEIKEWLEDNGLI